MKTLFHHFGLNDDRDNFTKTVENIGSGVRFKGTNLWILICAIVIASVGLNTNSTAVIIGAMLISPLMGPLLGIGLSVGINDLELLKLSIRNYGFSIAAGLISSTLYFIVSPIGEAHSELLARTTPAIWDVMIAFFGGLAGIIATSSKNKANVIPGVAIATALMPPLCTAGFGLAHLEWNIFFGAIYLFIINSVFIILATLLTIRFLRFPLHKYSDTTKAATVQKFIWFVVIITLIPSIFAAYNIVKNNRFTQRANRFIISATEMDDNFLLNKKIDLAQRTITLIYGGKGLTEIQKKKIQSKLTLYNITDAKLIIREGFSISASDVITDVESKYLAAITSQETEYRRLHDHYDSLTSFELFQKHFVDEAIAEHSNLKEVSVSILPRRDTTILDTGYLVYYRFSKAPRIQERSDLTRWTEVKMGDKKYTLLINTK